MKKERKIITISALVLAAVIAVCAALFFSPNVKADAETWGETQLLDVYEYGETLTVPTATVTADGVRKEASHIVTFPNGKTTTASVIELSVAGDYTVEYFATINGVTYKTTKKFAVKTVAYQTTAAASSVSYGKYTEYGANSEGLLVRLANNDALTFTKYIDVANITKATDLITVFITPDIRGAADFNKLIVTLTDSEDPSIYLTYQIKRLVRTGNVALFTNYVVVAGNGQDMTGYESGGKIHVNNEYGTPINNSFTATKNDPKIDGWSGPVIDVAPDVNPVNLAYDSSEIAVYVQGKLIADMDNTEFFRTLWKGFPSGRAKLSVSANGYNSTTANFCITRIAGISADDLKNNEFKDEEGPVITVECDDENNMPKARKGSAYPVPNASAKDVYSGECAVTARVYRNYKKDNQISVGIIDGKFTPDRIGDYTIVYTAKDSFGNVTDKLLFVRAESVVDDIQITLPATSDELLLGNELIAATPSISGGSGKVSYKVYIVHNGIEEEYKAGYRPTEEGEYTVKYVAVDYIGTTAVKSYVVTAKRNSEPLLIEKYVLPRIFVSGAEYVLPNVIVNDYSSGKLVQKAASIKVTDKNGEKTYASGATFTPEIGANGDKVKIAIVFANKTLKEEAIPAIIAKTDSQIRTDNYFYGADEVVIADENGKNYRKGLGILVKSACEKSSWTFANPLIAGGLSFKFTTVSGLTNYSSVTFTMTDAINAEQSVKIKVYTAANSNVEYGGKAYSASFALANGADLAFDYSDGTMTITSGGKIFLAEIAGYENGKAFEGFSSGKVYVDFSADNVTAPSRYIVEEICDNVISRAFGDYAAPMFVLPEANEGKQSRGTIYTLNACLCGDVFAPNSTVTLTLYAPNGSVVTDKNGNKLQNASPFVAHRFLLDSYGTYRAEYTISEKDWAGNATTYTFVIKVPDTESPTIKFNDGVKTAKVGDVIVVPSFTVSDNVTAKADIYTEVFVINPNGRLIRLENANSIKCEYAGEYTFVVYATDIIESIGADGSVTKQHGNVAIARYVITVGE